MTGIRRSLIWSYSTKYSLLVVQLVSTIVIARLVTPDDIGIYSVAAVFIGLGQLIREFGVNRYIVQEIDLTQDRIKAASTLNLLFGWSAGIVVFLIAAPVGSFYGRPEVQQAMHLLSLNFVFIPLGAITFAYLRRSMQFDRLMVIQVVCSVVGAGVGIATAWHGEGYRALIWSSIANSITTVLLCQAYRPQEIPLLPGIMEIGHVFRFCRYAGPESIVRDISETAPEWILGKVLGMEMVGFFSRATGTIALFGTIVLHGLHGVLMPYFSKALREGNATREPYIHAIGCVTGLAWPFFIVLGILAEPIIETLYGSQWREAVPLVQAMCIGAIPFALIAISQEVLTGLGQIRAVLHINLVMAIVRVLLILLTASHGILTVAIALQFGPLVRLVLVNRQITRHLNVRLRDQNKMLSKNLLLSLATATPAIIGIALYDWTLGYSTPRLLAVLTASSFTWLASVYLLKPPILQEIQPILIRLPQPFTTRPGR